MWKRRNAEKDSWQEDRCTLLKAVIRMTVITHTTHTTFDLPLRLLHPLCTRCNYCPHRSCHSQRLHANTLFHCIPMFFLLQHAR